MSSARLPFLCLLAGLALGLGACGSDSEPASEVADRAPALTGESSTSVPSTTTTPTETTGTDTSEQRTKAQQRRKRRAERRREQRADTTTAGADAQAEATPSEQPEPQPAPSQPDPPAQQPKPTPKPKLKPKPAQPPLHTITESASLTLVRKEGLTFHQQGNVEGTLDGTMRLTAKLGGQGVEADFVVTMPDGTLAGHGSARVRLEGSSAGFGGTARISKGTGAYAKLVPADLRFSGRVAADGSTSAIRLAGQLRW